MYSIVKENDCYEMSVNIEFCKEEIQTFVQPQIAQIFEKNFSYSVFFRAICGVKKVLWGEK
jgi:hypothetical protein